MDHFRAYPCPGCTGNLHFSVSLQSGGVMWLVLALVLGCAEKGCILRTKYSIFIARRSCSRGNQGDHGAAIKGRITQLLCGGQLPWKVNPLALDLHEQEAHCCWVKPLRSRGCVFCSITQLILCTVCNCVGLGSRNTKFYSWLCLLVKLGPGQVSSSIKSE